MLPLFPVTINALVNFNKIQHFKSGLLSLTRSMVFTTKNGKSAFWENRGLRLVRFSVGPQDG